MATLFNGAVSVCVGADSYLAPALGAESSKSGFVSFVNFLRDAFGGYTFSDSLLLNLSVRFRLQTRWLPQL